MFYINNNTMGCCGLNTTISPQNPISLWGFTTTEKEAQEFLSRCEQQLSFVKKDYPYPAPIFWSFKHPDQDIWFVSYQVYSNNGKVYKDSEIVGKRLIKTVDNSYDIQYIHKDVMPLDIYLSTQNNSVESVHYVQGFGTSPDRFFAFKGKHKAGTLYACTLYVLNSFGSQEILKKLREETDILFEKKWHNPFYMVAYKDTPLDERDPHTLLTLFFKDK